MSENALALSILNSLNTRIAVISQSGAIWLVNDAWSRFAQEHGDPENLTTGIGVNYLDAIQRAVESGDENAELALNGIRAVLDGSLDRFELKYPCHSPTDEVWYLMRVTPLVDGRGAVIAHIDITAEHLAARSHMRHMLRSEAHKSDQRESAALERMDIGASEALSAETQLLEQYKRLLNAAVERRTLKIERTTNWAARGFARALARHSAGPRDVVRLHTQAVAQETADLPLQKRHMIMEEARLLLLEVLGSLAGTYRDMILANLELKHM